MTNQEEALQRFQNEVVGHHKMEIVKDDGLYRHLRFRRSGKGWYLWFDLITWPGTLTIKGDMGTYVFSRIEDMFSFFRSSKELSINPSYWHEKIDAQDKRIPTESFDYEYFKGRIFDYVDNYGVSEKQKAEVVKSLEEDVFYDEPSEETIRTRLHDFQFETTDEGDEEDEDNFFHGQTVEFTDLWEVLGQKYTFHYLYCLYQIVWGIQQYDEVKKAAEVAA